MGKGTENLFTLSGGFNITGQQPIDSRLVVKNVSDLYLVDTWDGVGLYNGLVVAIQSTGSLFVLKDRDNYTDAASWVAVGGDVSADLSALTARVGVVEGKINVAADSGLDATNALKVKIDSTVTGNILQVSENGLSVVASQSEYSLDAVAEPEAGYAAQYQFKKDGAVQTTINIPKDQFLKSATYDADADELVFVFDTTAGETTSRVSVKDLVDTYTAGSYITITDNAVAVDYDSLKAQLDADLKVSFGIATISADVAQNKTDIADVKSALNTEGTGLVARVTAVETSVSGHETRIAAAEATISTHNNDISGIKSTLEDCKVRNVNTDAVHGIALTHTDLQGEDGVLDTVGISVDLDTLAAAVIAKHDVPVPDANKIKLAAAGSFTEDTNVQAAIESLDSRIKAAVSGGVTSVVGGNGISVNATDANNPTVSVVTADLIAAGSALKVTDNKIDLTWEIL